MLNMVFDFVVTYWLSLSAATIALVVVFYFIDWVVKKLAEAREIKKQNIELLDENRELQKQTQGLRGEATAVRAQLTRIREGHHDLESDHEKTEGLVTQWRDRAAESEEKLAKEKKDNNKLRDELRDMRKQADEVVIAYKKRQDELKKMLEKAYAEARKYHSKAQRIDWMVRQVSQVDGRIWETPVKMSVPPFRKRTPRQACIISMMNLKGGVGKSTIAANLGATLWKNFDRRVLLVDLDFQASLTSLCLRSSTLQVLRQEKAFVQSLFEREMPDYERLSGCLHQIRPDHPNCRCDLIATDEALAAREDQIMMQWLVGETDDDIRFRLRKLLRSDLIQDRFDYIILDCPPRNTTASINALAASDFVMVPVLPDPTSAEAVPRLLSVLQRMKNNDEVPLCNEIEVLGIVANRVIQDGRLTPDEKHVWESLRHKCEDRWGEEVHRFERSIPDKVQFGRAAAHNELAVFDNPDIEKIFIALAQEIEAKVPFTVDKTDDENDLFRPTRPIARLSDDKGDKNKSTPSGNSPGSQGGYAAPLSPSLGTAPTTSPISANAGGGGQAVVFPPTSPGGGYQGGGYQGGGYHGGQQGPAGFPQNQGAPPPGGGFPQGYPQQPPQGYPQGGNPAQPPQQPDRQQFPQGDMQLPKQFYGGQQSGGRRGFAPPRPSGNRKPRPL